VGSLSAGLRHALPWPGRPGGDRAARPVSRGEYVHEVVRALWPEPARVVSAGFASPGRRGVTEFLVLPNDRRAALLLPRRPRRAAAAALRNYKASASRRDQLRFRALALGARVGLGEVLPHRIRIEHGPSARGASITECLSAALNRDLVVSVYISPPRANRKPVLQVLTLDGELIGFAKVGVTGLTRELVRTEADSLEFLAGAPLSYVQVPRLLWRGQWHDHEVLIQESLSGSGRPDDITELTDAMVDLAGVCGLQRSPAAQSPYWRRLRERLDSLPQRDLAGALLQAVGSLESAAGPTELLFGSWHGDWTPWNMTMSYGRALLWDWERFTTGVPVGFDAMHYQFQRALVGGRTDAEAAAEAAVSQAPVILPPLGVDPAGARLVAMLYLIEIGIRYLHDRQADAGGRRGKIDTWLLPVLSRHTDQPGTRSPDCGEAHR
jgi:hypothetical protein